MSILSLHHVTIVCSPAHRTATRGPGFTVDEPAESLGERLQLPPWLAAGRDRIERGLHLVSVDPWNDSAGVPSVDYALNAS